MKKTIKLIGIVTLAVIIGFTMAACSSGNGGKNNPDDTNPDSKTIAWTQDSTNYKLALTALTSRAASSTHAYILSVGTSGYNAGSAVVTGNDFKLTPWEDGSTVITINIDSSSNKVTTSATQSIKVTSSTGVTSNFSIPVTNAQGTVTNNTGGVSRNPFVGTWKYVGSKYDGNTVSVSSNLTWTYRESGYSESGSYAFIDNTAIYYDSDGDLLGYATVSGNTMVAKSIYEGDFTLTKQ